MRKLALIAILLSSLFSACNDNKGCPDDMEECTLKDGTKIVCPRVNAKILSRTKEISNKKVTPLGVAFFIA